MIGAFAEMYTLQPCISVNVNLWLKRWEQFCIGCSSLLFTLKKIYAINDVGTHLKQFEIPVDKALQLRVALIDKEILRIARRKRHWSCSTWPIINKIITLPIVWKDSWLTLSNESLKPKTCFSVIFGESRCSKAQSRIHARHARPFYLSKVEVTLIISSSKWKWGQ